MKDYYLRVMIKTLFKKGFATKENDWERCDLRNDEMGEYFLFYYPGYDPNYWYSNWDAVFGEWTNEIDTIPGVKFRYIKDGLGKEDNYRHVLMKKDGKYYLIKGIDIRQDDDIMGPRGKQCFKFGEGDNISIVKTERSLNTMLGKLDITEL